MERARSKQAAAVQDLSGFGRCSITVALPVLSAMGVQTSCLPTAVLSTHTGGFTGYTFRDLTADMRPFYEHWLREGLRFDALYTGYLGSVEQIGIVSDFLCAFRQPGTITLVDPVMGDHGKLYPLYSAEMAAGIERLCAGADVITPNMTEAALLTGMAYRAEGHDEKYLSALCERLLSLGCKQVVLTGVSPAPDLLGAASHDGKRLRIYTSPRINAQYDGTGDLFASVLLGALLWDWPLDAAAALAADFTRNCVEISLQNGTNPHYGVDFERLLWRLGQRMLAPKDE